MPPRKRKQGPAGAQQDDSEQQQQAMPEQELELDRSGVARKVKEKLELLDRAVEEQCKAITETAQEIVDALMQDFRIQLIGVNKQTREMAWADYITTREHKPAAASAAEARVHSLLQEAQEVSMQTVAATRTTRSTRTRGHAADADPPTAAPGAARASRRAAQPRQPVPKFEEGPSSTCPSSPRMEGGRAAGPAAAEEAAQDTVAVAGTSAEGRQVSGAEARAQARIDAKMAAAFAGAAGRRTVAREAMPGEQMYSKSGSPLSVLPGLNAGRPRRGNQLQVGLTPAPPPTNTAALGCVTLLKREAPAVAAAGVRGGRGRGRKREVVQPDSAAIMITTADGQSFMVDSSGDGLISIPESHRGEVRQQLEMLQRLAASALGVSS